MSQLRIRGQETTVTVVVDGKEQIGSFRKISEFKLTPRQDLPETGFLGETEDDIDFMHHGFDFSFNCEHIDDELDRFLDQVVLQNQNGLPYPEVGLVVSKKYRDPGLQARVDLLEQVRLKIDDESWASRKDYMKTTITGKCKTRSHL